MATQSGLNRISDQLRRSSEAEIDQLRQMLRIGVQSDTQVTLTDCKHLVTQAYCSALPITYCAHPISIWERFARLILEASYESTICAAILNSHRTGNNKAFLTFLGGGAFGNPAEWITSAIERAIDIYKTADLDLAFVSYGRSSENFRQISRSTNR